MSRMQVWKHLTEWEFATTGFKGQPVGLVTLRLSSHQLRLPPLPPPSPPLTQNTLTFQNVLITEADSVWAGEGEKWIDSIICGRGGK